MPITVYVGDYVFPSKASFIEYCRKILYQDDLETEISGQYAEFVNAILQARPDKLKEIGSRKTVRFWRKMHAHNTPSFFVELDDGEFLDISFMKFIMSYPNLTGA